LIGVVGPDDTVSLIEQIAHELGFGAVLMPVRYTAPEESVGLLRTIWPACASVLFSGRMPYRLAVLAGFPADRLDYIPHEGTDLFRVLALAALESDRVGILPRFSFDTIPERDVAESYEELGLDPAFKVIPLESDDQPSRIDAARIEQAHRALVKSGEAERCATCIRDVYERLAAAGVPAMRIDHSRNSVRQALLRSKLRHDLNEAESSQIAACLITGDKRVLAATVAAIAKLTGGRAVDSATREAMILTTKGALHRTIHPILRSPSGSPTPAFAISVGVGINADRAETHARDASERRPSEEDRVFEIDGSAISYRIVDQNAARDARQEDLELAQMLDVPATVVRKLISVFRTIDPNGFTAVEFAAAYSVQPRSARRLLSTLKDRGFVQEQGSRAKDRAGRPQVVYRIFLDRFLSPSS
jgi:DNA-binding NarL/FixJ family response regulator